MNLTIKIIWVIGFLVLSLGCWQRDQLAPVIQASYHPYHSTAKLHRVMSGETLYAIAFRYDQDYRQLAAINHLVSPYTVRVGQILHLVAQVQKSRPLPLPFKKQWIPPAIKNSPEKFKSRWLWPLKGSIIHVFIPAQGKKGIDIKGKPGEKIHAAAGGTVAYAGAGLSGYGNLIIIKHDGQFMTAYGNNFRNFVKEGQRIHSGQVIAEVGHLKSNCLGLHFEIRRFGKPMNPLQYLS